MDFEQAKLRLIALKGAPLSVVIGMAIYNRPVGRNELINVTGYKKDVVSAALDFLISLGLVVRTSRFSWQLTLGAKQLPLVFDVPALEAPDPARAIKSPSRPVVGIGGSFTKEETLETPNNPPPPPEGKAIKSPSRADFGCSGKPCQRRADLLARMGVGYLEAELHAVDHKFDGGERRQPFGISYESIEAEINAMVDEGTSDRTGLLVYRVRQLATGERFSKLSFHAYETAHRQTMAEDEELKRSGAQAAVASTPKPRNRRKVYA